MTVCDFELSWTGNEDMFFLVSCKRDQLGEIPLAPGFWPHFMTLVCSRKPRVKTISKTAISIHITLSSPICTRIAERRKEGSVRSSDLRASKPVKISSSQFN